MAGTMKMCLCFIGFATAMFATPVMGAEAAANSESGFREDKGAGLRGLGAETGGKGSGEKTVVRRLTGGDFSLTFRGAAPFTYNHATGGGAWNDGTVGEGSNLGDDIKAELEGGQFACGDIVSYLLLIELDSDVSPSDQTVEFDFSFSADSTGQSGAAHVEVVAAEINYGAVENGGGGGVGTFGLDSAISDDLGSTTAIITQGIYESGIEALPFAAGDPELLMTVRITDLEVSETLVLRIDVLTGCDPSSSPTGNLQAKLLDGRVTNNPGDTDRVNTISSGAQTVNLKKVGDLCGASEPCTPCIGTVIDLGAAQASASSEERSDLSADLAIDGDDTTRWSSTHDDIAWLDGEWITVDLGALNHISSVSLFWETAYAGSYDLQVADNLAGPWTTIVAITDSDGDVDVLDGLDEVTQYVRLLCRVRASNRALTTLYGCSLWEIELFGCPVPV